MPTIKINGTDIYFEDHGPEKAPVVVLSPMLFMDTRMYDPLVELLSEEYRVITYDHRGQGNSARPIKRSDIETSSQDVIELIEHLELAPCHYVGSCLGAYVGLYVAANRSGILKSCTLMGAVAEDETPQTLRDMDAFVESMKKHGPQVGMRSYANMIFGKTFLASREPVIEHRREKIMEHLNHLSASELDNAKQIWHRPAILAQSLKNLSIPFLILAGDEDTPEHSGGYRRLAEMIPTATYKVIRGAGYSPILEQPQEVVNVLYDFLENAEQAFSLNATKSQADRTKHSRLQ